MDKKSISLLILLGMVLFSINIAAQELWSLEKCINYAFENNLQIKQSVLDAASSDQDLRQSKLNMVPSLNSGLSQNYRWGRNADPQTNVYATKQTQQFYANLNSEITLFDGLQQINNVRQKQFDYLAKKYDSPVNIVQP